MSLNGSHIELPKPLKIVPSHIVIYAKGLRMVSQSYGLIILPQELGQYTVTLISTLSWNSSPSVTTDHPKQS